MARLGFIFLATILVVSGVAATAGLAEPQLCVADTGNRCADNIPTSVSANDQDAPQSADAVPPDLTAAPPDAIAAEATPPDATAAPPAEQTQRVTPADQAQGVTETNTNTNTNTNANTNTSPNTNTNVNTDTNTTGSVAPTTLPNPFAEPAAPAAAQTEPLAPPLVVRPADQQKLPPGPPSRLP